MFYNKSNTNQLDRKVSLLTEAIIVPVITGTPGRDANFDDKRRNFEAHSAKLADTANMVATAAGCRNKKTVEEIFKSSKQVHGVDVYLVLQWFVTGCQINAWNKDELSTSNKPYGYSIMVKEERYN